VSTTTTRHYRIRPSTDPLDPDTAEAGFRTLHDTLTTAEAVLDCRLTSGPGVDSPISYSMATDTETSLPLDRLFHGLLPDRYEITPDDQTETALQAADPHRLVGWSLQAVGDRPADWQTALTPFARFTTDRDRRETDTPTTAGNLRVPLAVVCETLAATEFPVLVQLLIRPRPDWYREAQNRVIRLTERRDTRAQRLFEATIGPFLPDPGEETQRQPAYRRMENDAHRPLQTSHLHPETQARIDAVEAKDARRSFDVAVRAVVFVPEADSQGTPAIDSAERLCRELTAAFSPAGTEYTRFDSTLFVDGPDSPGPEDAGSRVLQAITDREFEPHRRWWHRFRPRLGPRPYRTLVADPSELGSFLLVDGDAVTPAGKRALAVRDSERTAVTRPPEAVLEYYRGDGLTLGVPQTESHTAAPNPVVLPPDLQRLHVAWIGRTGSGKSTATVTGILENHSATRGASILIDPKGDGLPREYLRAHYARYGTLADVRYFDCAELLPAFSFFDIRADLAAGVSRTTAVSDRLDHYIEILTHLVGPEGFAQAIRSPDIIRYLVKAGFDPVHGADAFSHLELHGLARRMHERQAAPAVSDPNLERMLGGVVANRPRTFDEIMQGVANRMEKIPVDDRLGRVFDHVPVGDDPHFDLGALLDDRVVIVFDLGGLRTEAKRALTLVILSNLWTALRRRVAEAPDVERHPLVNVYIEEAAAVAGSGLVTDLLAQGRGFDCSVTLSTQFPAQLRTEDDRVYEELLNNVGTLVTGTVALDEKLSARLATDTMPPAQVSTRLRALERGQWLVSLPGPFGEPEPDPFVLTSGALPAGHPEGDAPLSPVERRAFEQAVEAVVGRTEAEMGLRLTRPGTVQSEESTATTESAEGDTPAVRTDSALPYTKRLPTFVRYEESAHALVCSSCGNRYDATSTGMARVLGCCHDASDVDPDDVPICAVNLKLSAEEREASEYSLRQLLFLQTVYNASQLRYDPPEYDLLADSMLRLQEYVGIDSEEVEELLEADLLRHDTDHPHRLYSVTSDGRHVVGEGHRRGLDYGDGKGDLGESTQHVFGVEVARRWLEQEYADNPESPVTSVETYYEDDGQERLDLVGLDSAGAVHVAVEVERINNDVREAVPADYDKMAACDPDEAVWIVMKQHDGHTVLDALNDPLEGPPRVEKTYAKTTPPQQFRIDTPGCTAIYPVDWVRARL
jgi:hypothetical protein